MRNNHPVRNPRAAPVSGSIDPNMGGSIRAVGDNTCHRALARRAIRPHRRRRYKVTCPAGQSYLGYQCYADTDPESHWKLNYGGGVMVHFDRLAFGVRVTGESKTAIVGLNF